MSDTLPIPAPSPHDVDTLPSSFPAAPRVPVFDIEPDPFPPVAPGHVACPVVIVDDSAPCCSAEAPHLFGQGRMLPEADGKPHYAQYVDGVQHPEQLGALLVGFQAAGARDLIHPEFSLDAALGGAIHQEVQPLPERPVGAWTCSCGAECGPTLIVCPACSLSLHDQPKVFSVTCQGCGHIGTVREVPTFTKCGECGQRTAHGELIGRWVVEPEAPHFILLRVTVGQNTITLRADALLAVHVARDILSIALPGAE